LKNEEKAYRREFRRDRNNSLRYAITPLWERRVDRRERRTFWQGDSRRDRVNYSYNYNNHDNNYNYYNDNDYYNDYNDGTSWKQQLLRSVLSSVIGNRLGGSDYYAARQNESSPYYNYAPYNYPSNGGGYYNSQPQYYPNYGIPYAENYQPVGYYDESPYQNIGGLLGSIPFAQILHQFTGSSFASEILSNILAQGYNEGFLSGQFAKQNGYGEESYYDPYAFEDEYQNAVYDPYSLAMGENRQTLSQGYELGYQDALNGQTEYDPHTEGNVDLVSLLLNNVLSGV